MLDPPFTSEQFLGIFAAYNLAIWPAQIIAYVLGLIAIGALWFKPVWTNRIILTVLAIMWACNGIVYHFRFFSQINPIAIAFAVAFTFQAVLLAIAATTYSDVRFERGRFFPSAAALLCIAYAMLIYPLLGYWAGHGLMTGPLFGVAPCPTTIFTIGFLLLARGKWVVWLSIIPIAWSLIGVSAALQLGMVEDFGLSIAGILLIAALFARGRRTPLLAGQTMPDKTRLVT